MNRNLLFIRMIMRTTIIIYCMAIATSQLLFASSLKGQIHSRKIDFAMERITLHAAIKKLQREQGLEFAFDDKALDLNRRYVAKRTFRSSTIASVLKSIFQNTEITFEEKPDGTVVLKKEQRPARIGGSIKDEQGEPLVGASVQIVELNRTVVTDVRGNYSITARPGTYTLVVKYISFEEVRRNNITVVENETREVNFTLKSAVGDIDEVVVTALGIKREEKALGYAATVVKGEQLTEALSSNWMDALSGKVAGLNLMRSNAGPVGSTKIILRGENNLTGENEALIVVDGIVINNGSGRRSANASDAIYGTGSDNMPVDYGSGMDDINPEDIESVTVLKGPGAAALYGQRAANGAVIITTKSGSKKKGIGITVNSNTAFQSVNRWPDLQYEYGQGLGGAAHYSYGASVDGPSTSGTSSAYGPKFDGQHFFQYDPETQMVGSERTPWRAYDNITSFFDVGKTFTNSVTIDGGTDKTTARFSATNVQNKWIVPNTGYKRNTVALSVNSKVTDKLTISSKVNYNNRWSDNLPGAGYGNQSLMYWFIFWQPSADVNWLKNYWVKGKENLEIRYPYSTYPENPYAISYEFINSNNRHTFTGNAQASYQFTKAFSAQVRASMDFSSENRTQNRPYDAGSRLREGSHRTQQIFSKESNADFLLRYGKKLDQDFEISASVGGSTQQNEYRRESLTSDGLSFPGVYNHNNSKYGVKTDQAIERFEVNSVYGLFTGSYKDYLFLDVTGRMDWTSTLAAPEFPDKKKGFFYPSVNGSFILSEVVDLPSLINLVKLRASFAEVGSGVQRPYQTLFAYTSPNSLIGGSLANPTSLVNPLIEPLRTRSIEFGTDIRLLKDRVHIDVAAYQGNTFNQHLYRIVDAASGARTRLMNIGEVKNRGLEVALNTKQIVNKDGFNWSSMITFTTNRNKIVELADSSLVLQQRSVGSGQIVAFVGGSMGDLYGLGYQRAPDGQVIYHESTGYAKITESVVYLGNTIPKGKASFGNTITYKGWRMNVLFDTQWGAVGHSLTHYKMAEQGKTRNTLPGRYNGIIGNGVIENADGTFRKNDVIAKDIDQYYRSHYGADNAEGSTYPTDFLKFREARLDYTFNRRLASRLGLQKATIGVYGRDLFIWTKWPAFDPEFGTLDGSDIVKGFEIAQFPSTRTFGVNLTVGF
ncbi:TonB-linked SusC/RagA family outer membrane protein [Sphingobacterium allocomposti]|uniref:TonB-linked SusC/RagA family outer membrane protein n=1 Tax=Sphingobacterium allocomposti TaxID=415956 RepID=A0A5S5DM56_9SPHI|nr:SusC/RagA family TonB-linked outer membrane protein [Sphingobacterium composti Yoo et al. 2007 non Ten et al. 2007]TYP95819.1 TonB-linked SusC/RagA family outer membrane protein [Sphingobacterium composti Yoo et al. 2007 non Ten et al. 2007]